MDPRVNSLFSTFFQNPMAMLTRRFNIPQGINTQDPNAIIQYLLNTGQITQQQLNQANAMRDHPMLQQFIQRNPTH